MLYCPEIPTWPITVLSYPAILRLLVFLVPCSTALGVTIFFYPATLPLSVPILYSPLVLLIAVTIFVLPCNTGVGFHLDPVLVDGPF